MPTGKPKILKVFEFYVKFDDGHGTTTGRDVTVAASSKAKAEATLNDALGKGELAVDVHGAEINLNRKDSPTSIGGGMNCGAFY